MKLFIYWNLIEVNECYNGTDNCSNNAIASTPMVVSCVFATLDGVETALYAKVNSFTDSDTVSTYQVSSVQLVTDKN